MANPQRENGTTDIAHEIMEALMRTRIPGEARQIIDTIFRQTYGWHKKEDRIALSQFCGFTLMKKPNVVRAIKKAFNMNIIIIRKDNELNSFYSINKNFDQWKPLPKQTKRGQALSKKIMKDDALSEKIIGVIQNDNASLSEMIPTKQTTTKQTITKQNIIINNNAPQEILEKPVKVKKIKKAPNMKITKMLEALKIWTHREAFSDSKYERNIGLNLVRLFEKIGKEEFLRRLNLLLKDDFKEKNCNSVTFIYNQLKSFSTKNPEKKAFSNIVSL
jgi:phage replication O-like protein O